MAKTTKVEIETEPAPRPWPEFMRFSNLLFALAVIGAVLSITLYFDSQHELKAANTRLATAQQQLADYKKNPNAIATQETQDLVNKVGQLVVLPADEQPTIATVTDLSKLQDQPFFANAKVGDKVLIYTNAKKAILYRASENKIIEIAPLNLGEEAAAGTVKTKTPKAVTNDTVSP